MRAEETNPLWWLVLTIVLLVGLMALSTALLWLYGMGYGMMGWGWGWGVLMMIVPALLLVLFLLAVLSVLAPRAATAPFVPPPTSSAVEVLNVRYARGEISREEYLRMRADLEGMAPLGRDEMERRLALFAILAVGVLVASVAALGYGGLAPSAALAQVMIVNYSFRPSSITVQAGTTVLWVNMDFVEHTVSFGTHENPTGVESPLLGHMGSFSYTFTEPGVYEYHCDPHPYMRGSVTVASQEAPSESAKENRFLQPHPVTGWHKPGGFRPVSTGLARSPARVTNESNRGPRRRVIYRRRHIDADIPAER